MNFCGQCGDPLQSSNCFCEKCKLFTSTSKTEWFIVKTDGTGTPATSNPTIIAFPPVCQDWQHDMAQGPCVCGKWHLLTEWPSGLLAAFGLGAST